MDIIFVQKIHFRLENTKIWNNAKNDYSNTKCLQKHKTYSNLISLCLPVSQVEANKDGKSYEQ